MASATLSSLRPPYMGALDRAAADTEAVMASGVSPAAREAAAQHEADAVGHCLAAHPGADAQMQFEAEMEAG